LVGGLVLIVGWAAGQPSVAAPQRITAQTACPVAGCTQPDGSCHAAAAPPSPDGSFEMVCPRITGCSDIECHAWNRIDSTSSKPNDVSLNLWIIVPVVLAVGLVLLVRKL
jgi:hypothetical protein